MYLSSVSSRLHLHDTNSWELKKSYGCYDGLMRDISWSDDGKYILQVNCKGLIEILTPADHDIRSLQHIPLKDTWSASFHREGHRNVAIGTKSGNVLIWDTKNKTITKTFPTPTYQASVNYISYNAKNNNLAATMNNGETVIYGLVSNIPVLTVKVNCSKSISAMKFHHETRCLLGLATDEGHVVLRDINTNKDKAFFDNIHAAPVSDIAYSLINKDVMLSSGYDKIVHVYDIRLQNVVSTIKTSYTLTSIAVNADNQVAIGTKNGVVMIYDLRDLTNPFTTLKGHNEEVKKVAFQPSRKKPQINEISIQEDTELHLTPCKPSPGKPRTSDMFLISASPNKDNLDVSQKIEDKNADSFLVLMGLDKSNEDDANKSQFKESSMLERNKRLDVEKNMSKISTPLHNQVAENLAFPSPILNGAPDDGRPLIVVNGEKEKIARYDSSIVEELKDFIELSLADVAEDNKNYFLHIMMVLTKQRLSLEKQMAAMSSQISMMQQNQNELVDANKRLALQVEQLKYAANNNL
ncbi:uncharacterized protein LOC133527355 [Cydia pomonella]|uniref:uncharacterized protein LOC133527355 n=1 Tax=Cydia pomonella TaxID=82600 RepID=UPI002ADE2908|nr:uncharacterized protein LOC133527355 [Cydia pomonella]